MRRWTVTAGAPAVGLQPGPPKPSPRCWSSVGTVRTVSGSGSRMGNAGNGAPASMPARSSTGATGTPAAARRRHQRVPLPRGDGRADDALQLGAATAPFVEAQVRDAVQLELVAEARPEVLLVEHAERDLPPVRRREEPVARHGCGRALGTRRSRVRRLRPDRSRWPGRRSWRCRGRPPRRSRPVPARRRRSRTRRPARTPGRPSAGEGCRWPRRLRASVLPTRPGSSRHDRGGRRAGRAARNPRWSSRRSEGSVPARPARRAPSRASAPGRNPSTSTSACAASSSARPRSAGSFRSSSRLRLPALTAAKRPA